MTKNSKPEYLAKVLKLAKEETERLYSRMPGKLSRRLEKGKLNSDEALAIQLEQEDEQLQEWRNMAQARIANNKVKNSAKTKTIVKNKAQSKSKPAETIKLPSKQKVVTKIAAPSKSKAANKAKTE